MFSNTSFRTFALGGRLEEGGWEGRERGPVGGIVDFDDPDSVKVDQGNIVSS